MVPPGRRLEQKRTGNSVLPTMKRPPENQPQEVLAGLVERVTYHNAENGCQIASKSDPLSRPRPTPLQACECVRSDGAETGVAEPHIAEQSRSWRAVNGERWVMRGS